MITKDTIDRIFETVRIEDVVGDYVQLKKRGSNYLGLCPFHNEKTPSFNVNPARNIYKCFGCGKGGNAVNFIMEHEHFSYPEALRQLAAKYSIEIEETTPDPRELEIRDEKESLYVLNSFAQQYFSEILVGNEEGKSVGLSYLRERGFTENTIQKFQIGYSLNDKSALSREAINKGYKIEFLVKTGLSYAKNEEHAEIKNEDLIDRFRSRVIFPIHNLSGRIIGFGGRILKKDEKLAKYVNSPESDIYHKSKSLYGIYFAKKTIVQRDNCYLVEGYTDVISLHQSGIENAVASSGTSLTVEQIRLIGRYTKNVTVLYDGDAAGIKASLRGIDLILEEGLNVKVVLFPDGDDPDSYRRKHGDSMLVDFIQQNDKDFVVFKTDLLMQDVQNDPIRKAGLIRDIVDTISKIPDPITRSVYIKKCSAMMEIGEQLLISEMNKFRRNQLSKTLPANDAEELLPEIMLPPVHGEDRFSLEIHEREIIRLLLNFGIDDLTFVDHVEDINQPSGKKEVTQHIKVSKYIVDDLVHDEIVFEDKNYNYIFSEYIGLLDKRDFVDPQIFLNSENPEISSTSVGLLSDKYVLSENWIQMHRILVPDESTYIKSSVKQAILYLKNKKVMIMLNESRKKILESQIKGEDYTDLLVEHQRLENLKIQIAKNELGIDILH